MGDRLRSLKRRISRYRPLPDAVAPYSARRLSSVQGSEHYMLSRGRHFEQGLNRSPTLKTTKLG
eukprot:4980799-Prymnesium_polylepis.1